MPALLAGLPNPTEEAFSKIKGIPFARHRLSYYTRGPVVEAMGKKALEALTVSEARGFFEHCGYRTVVQPF